MDLFCFASNNLHNIQLGLEAGTWAVCPSDESNFARGRATKARDLRPGSRGVFYCSEPGVKAFLLPFEVTEEVDTERVLTNTIWSGSWVLPFKFRPLGRLDRRVKYRDAARRWPRLNVQSVTAFVSHQISEDEWGQICFELKA